MKTGKLRKGNDDKWNEIRNEMSFWVLGVETGQQEQNDGKNRQEFPLSRPLVSSVDLLEVCLAFVVAQAGDPWSSFDDVEEIKICLKLKIAQSLEIRFVFW